MSSNKIGFLCAFGIYILLGISYFALDFKNIFIGEAKRGAVAFSIALNNIASKSRDDLKPRESPKKSPRESPKKPPKIPRENLKEIPKEILLKIAQNAEKIAESLPQDSSDSGDSSDSSEIKDSRDSSDSAKNSDISAFASDGTFGEYDEYFMQIRAIIDKYHTKSREIRFLKGAVEVAFLIEQSGALRDLRIIKSSNSARLDNLAIETIKRASKSFPAPKKSRHIKITLVYKLR